MKRLLAAICCMGLLAPSAKAGGAGTTAASFLKIDPSAREAALAGAVTALTDDSPALINYNPALIAAADYKQLSFTHTGWLSGVQLESLSYAHPHKKTLTFGAGINYLHTPDVPKTDASGNPLGSSFNSADGVFSLGVANRFHENIFAGASFKTIRQSMDDRNATAFAGDAGLLVRYEAVALGLAVSNFGSELKLYEQESPLPLTYKAGLSVKAGENFTLLGEADKPSDTVPIIRAALEYSAYGVLVPSDRYSLRLGYRTSTAESAGPGFTIGAGMRLKRFSLDYCFVPMGDLGNTNRISISVGFGATRAEQLAQASAQKPVAHGSMVPPKPVKRRKAAVVAPEDSVLDDAYKPRLKDPHTYLLEDESSGGPQSPDAAFSAQDRARTRIPRKSSTSPVVE
ncbi:MAG: PorV/PorQ family protein [Elusimicrobiaceae bacterium]|nr:PorV/PorQ family protein [Elusimicrobiaceae bacterium]